MRQLQETQSPIRPSIIISCQVLAAEDGGDEEPLELPDGFCADDEADGNGLHHPPETEDSNLTDSKPTGEALEHARLCGSRS